MLKRSLIVICAIFTVIGGIFAVVRANNGAPSAWQNAGNPTIQKVVDFAPNTLPPSSNFDCTPSNIKHHYSGVTRSDCLVTSAVGQAGSEGIIFNGTTAAVPVVPPRPFEGLRPIPNQGMFMTHTSATPIGTYLHFYRSIYDKLPANPKWVNGQQVLELTAPPDFSVKDTNNTLLAANLSTMAFSPDGNWMVVDLIGKGLVRINMATFEIHAFAPTLQPVNDYSQITAQIAINNDGSAVAVKVGNQNYFKVFDLGNCVGATIPIAVGTTPCPVRNFWNEINANIVGFKALYQPRFMNDTQLSFTAVYDFVSGSNFKTATFALTAPGVSPTGIDYLGLGDSFASGEGAFSYVAGTDTENNQCHLSSKSYAHVISSQLFDSGHAVSCSGAVTRDITSERPSYKGQVLDGLLKKDRSPQAVTSFQQNYIPGYLVQSEFVDLYKPEAITLSIGGNNIGFSDILSRCVSPVSKPKACYPTYEDRMELNQKVASIFNELVNTYKSLLKPGKRVYVVGYPQIVVDGNCANNVHFEGSEIEMASDLIDYLNATISKAAFKAGVRYVDISDAFQGHRMCETASEFVAVNGLTAGNDHGIGPLKVIGRESYHPNVLGHELLAQTIRLRSSNLTQPMPGADTALNAPALPASLDQRNLTKTGRTIRVLEFDGNLAPDTVVRGQTLAVTQNSMLKANTSYQVSIGGVQVGTATINAAGVLTTAVQVPANLDPGTHPLQITGVNILGQPIDVTKTVYVAGSGEDTDGDGLPDPVDSCKYIENANQDVDRDGVDDACDPLIGLPPPLILTNLKASVTLTNNTITLTKQ